uniref:Uncharacterized protein n=1 Tax=Arion vulgaris TaxID=1028688 RepID=A0A0B7BXG6_9EUPU
MLNVSKRDKIRNNTVWSKVSILAAAESFRGNISNVQSYTMITFKLYTPAGNDTQSN